jgi:stage V sporulation protein AC
MPSSNIIKHCVMAFIFGGTISLIGHSIKIFSVNQFKTTEEVAGLVSSVSLIFLSIMLTGFGLYKKLGKIAGAGTIIPITGFANSIASTAIEFKSEGYILGVGAKMFSLAGPVLVYGVSTAVLYGLVLFVFGG